MSTRISSVALVAMLAACGDAPTADTGVLAQVEAQQRADREDDGLIACAHGDAPMVRSCTVDRLQEARGMILTVRHPDGAFHRLLVTRDGRGVVAADGADDAAVTVIGNDIQVALGTDRYRLPATIKP